MKPEIKQMFVHALTSGEYEQVAPGPLRLKGENGKYKYCLIGVLVDLYCKETNTPWKEAVFDNAEGLYDPEVERWSGFRHNFFLNVNGITAYPSIHSDHWKVPFPVIAEAIREQM